GILASRGRGKATRGRPPRATVPRRGPGSDQPRVASKPGKAGGAKGVKGAAEGRDQPARGGIHAGRKGGRAARWRDHPSTRGGGLAAATIGQPERGGIDG